MNDTLQLSQAGAALIQGFEACMDDNGSGHYKAYFCPAKILTIGWGHTNDAGSHPFTIESVWSSQDCADAFTADMQGAEAAVRRLVKVPLGQHQFDALVSFTYNCGAGSLAGSTLLKLLNQGDYNNAALEFHKWTRGGGEVQPGLVRRRAAEALMFQKALPDDTVPQSFISAATTVTPRTVEVLAGATA